MRFLRKSLTGLFLLALTLGLLAYASGMVSQAIQARLNEDPRSRPVRERVLAVNVLPVTFDTANPVLRAFGEVRSRRTLELRSAASGSLVDLDPAFVEGGQVRAGQLLARIDPAEAQAGLDRAESDLLDARAEQRDAIAALELAQDELAAANDQVGLRERALKRQQDLVARDVGTASAVETAELALSTARQSVLSNRRAVANAQARIDQAATGLRRAEIARDEASRALADTEIRAAFDGTLSDVSVVAGRLVSGNEKLAQLVDPAQLEVAFRISTREYARLLDDTGRVQQVPVTVTLDVFGIDISARGLISRDSAAVGDGQTGRILFATLDAPRGFKPGDFVTVSVAEAPLPRVARLPATALDATPGVLALGADDRLEAVEVELLRRQDDDVLIRARDLQGREVVAERTPLLGAGIKVRPLRSGDAPDAPAAPELVELSDERRARLRAFVENNTRMPADARDRILGELAKKQVPAQMIQRLESRMGG